MAPQRLSVLSPPTPVKENRNRRAEKPFRSGSNSFFLLSAGPREFIDISAGFLLGRGRGPALQLDGHTKNGQSTPSVNESLLHRKNKFLSPASFLEESLAS